MSTNAADVVRPKVFISYSWTSPGHQEQVRNWAERLMADGIDVVIDIFDLKEGHDKYHFMERIVTDPNVTHVLILSDRQYAEKADVKKAGVGTESQIISSEVYGKVEQSKFIPIVCELDDKQEPFLPVFLRSRIWLNFSSPEAVNQNWEKLVRLLYGKPALEKPALGKPPAYLFGDGERSTGPLLAKYATFKQAFVSGSKMIQLYRQDFISACLHAAGDLRVRSRLELDENQLADKILKDSQALTHIRNAIVDWILVESASPGTEDFTETLLEFLESLLELKARPAELTNWHDAWFEAHSVFVYETFLYIVAALIKNTSFQTLHEVFSNLYLKPRTERYDNEQLTSFGAFYGSSRLLQLKLAPERQRLHSPAAELIKRQANRSDITFAQVIEAELLVFLMALISPDVYWLPQTSYYRSQTEFPLFLRAAQHRYFAKLATITGVSDAQALRDAFRAGYQRLDVNRWPGFYNLNRSFWECMNMEKLDSL